MLLVLLLLTSGGVVAQEHGSEGVTQGEEEPILTGIPAVVVFVAGAGLLIVSAEKFIGYLVKTANGLDVSLFLLAVVFTGIEFDDAILGITTNLEDLGGVALGTALGTALSLTGVTLALAAILVPFDADVPKDYLVLFALSPLVLVPFAVLGTVTVVHGVVLVTLYLLVLAYVIYREIGSTTPVFRDAEVTKIVDGGQFRTLSTELPFVPDRELSGWTWFGLSVVSLLGIIVAAESMALATEGIVTGYGVEGTVFGATVATAVLTLEDVFLTVEPVRRGVPEIGIGNVIGSVLFSVTANVGVIALVGDVVVDPNVLSWHLPMLVVSTALAAYFAHTGRMTSRHGYLLLGLYVCYWAVSLVVFGGIPVDL
ncbi:sodium:calcium antiporter [Halomarina pelagica]|uniref:sodium:calcium antiporter n=1 Tax=Halomarina pelagica TaxID=2961599 RepID=UPI0020C315AD|nr:sodium:proton exchanger [Halomarina sp. BND7]